MRVLARPGMRTMASNARDGRARTRRSAINESRFERRSTRASDASVDRTPNMHEFHRRMIEEGNAIHSSSRRRAHARAVDSRRRASRGDDAFVVVVVVALPPLEEGVGARRRRWLAGEDSRGDEPSRSCAQRERLNDALREEYARDIARVDASVDCDRARGGAQDLARVGEGGAGAP